jgi:hypothetical protein
MTIEQFDSLRSYQKGKPGYADETLMLYVLESLGRDYGWHRLATVVTSMDAIKNGKEWMEK